MNLQDKFEGLKKYILENNITESDMLTIMSNYIIEHSNYFLEKDIKYKYISPTTVVDFSDYSNIASLSRFNKESLAFQLASIAHQLLYINNVYIKRDEEFYSPQQIKTKDKS